jgi:hypothetical protein
MAWGVMTLSVQAKSSTETSSGSHSRARNVGPAKSGTEAKQSKGTPREINYQGWLGDTTDTTGITDVQGMIFELYAAPAGGTPVWRETHVAVTVDKGIFNVLLGSVTPIPSNIFTGDPLWLETQIKSDTLSPRKKLVSVGYAMKSEEADHAVHSDTADYASSSAPDSDWTVSGSNLYAQNTSWRVGIGTTSPSTDARLHVNANGAYYGVYGQGSTDKVAGVFGSAYGADYGVYGRGFAGKTAAVYGLAGGADYAGYFDGDVHVKGTVTMDTVVRYYSIPGAEFVPRDDAYDWYRSANYLYTGTGSNTYWYAGVHLPDGAVVTEVSMYVIDNDVTNNISFSLYRITHTGASSAMAGVSSSGNNPAVRTFIDNSISDATIDNKDYYYAVTMVLKSGTIDHRLYQLRIEYI